MSAKGETEERAVRVWHEFMAETDEERRLALCSLFLSLRLVDMAERALRAEASP